MPSSRNQDLGQHQEKESPSIVMTAGDSLGSHDCLQRDAMFAQEQPFRLFCSSIKLEMHWNKVKIEGLSNPYKLGGAFLRGSIAEK